MTVDMQAASTLTAPGPVREMARLENLAAVTGALAGVGGVVHGVGEVSQGNTSPGGFGFESWSQGRIASNLGGEPAISVVPNLLVSGILTVVVSLALAVWAARWLNRRHSGRVLAALAVLLLLVGGGIGPPVLGLLAALAAGGAHRVRTPGWAPGRLGRMLAPAWPPLFWVSIADATFLVLGSLAVGVVLDVDVSATFVYAFFLAMVVMPPATLAGMAHVTRHLPPEEAATAKRDASAARKGRHRRLTVAIGVVLVVALVIPAAMLALSLRTYDFDNSRSRLNGYLMTHTVSVRADPGYVFDFITYRMEEHNLSIAKAHERFEIVDGDGLTLGSRFIAEEWDDNEGVLNEYVVREVAPNRLIHMASTPSRILERDEDGNVEQVGTANAFVYFDLAPTAGGTELTQTVVIEMPNFLTKSLVDVIVLFEEENVWQEHLVEELEGLQAAIDDARTTR